MNMFLRFFGEKAQTKVVEVEGGRFEFKDLSKDTPIRVLWFTKYDKAKSTMVESRMLRMAPFRENGVVCEEQMPGGRKVALFFFEHGDFWRENGFVLDDEHLVYMYRDEMRLFTKHHNDIVLFDKKALRNLGYREYMQFAEEMFYFYTDRPELIPYDYFDYKGNPLTEYKNEQIARMVMLQIGMFVTKELSRKRLNEDRGHRLCELTWDAKTATTEDVKQLLILEKEENNLIESNADTLRAVIECFESANKQELFTRYMELFFTAYEQISTKDVQAKIQWICENEGIEGMKNQDISVYQKMHWGMDMLTKDLMKRTNFIELLKDYSAFEKAVSEYIGMEKNDD